MQTVVVVGASRGIGAAVAAHFVSRADRLIAVSRSPAVAGEWLGADISSPQGVAVVRETVGDDTLDAFLYMGGTWEANAFTDRYRFEDCSDAELANVIDVNLLAPIRLIQALLPALRRSSNPKVIVMGALSGLDNFPGREVANSASKFGLRGMVHALREALRPEQIGVTILNAGSVGTPEVLEDLARSGADVSQAIPLTDLLAVVECVLSLSRSTLVKEVHLPAMAGPG